MPQKIFTVLLFFFMAFGCGPQVHFIKVGSEHYPAKPEDYEVLVFISDERPEQDYKVIGMVFVEAEPDDLFSRQASDPKIVGHLKTEAKKHGADAIIDVHIVLGNKPDPEATLPFLENSAVKRAEAKAIVFVDNKDNTTKDQE